MRLEGEIVSKDEGGEGNEYGERRVSVGVGGIEKKGSVRYIFVVVDKKDNLMGKKNLLIFKSEGLEKFYIKFLLLDFYFCFVLFEILIIWYIYKEGFVKV